MWTFERKLLCAALIAWAVVAAIQLVAGPPLGHDEAAYAIVARGDSPDWLYRSRGVTLLAELGVVLGGADWQLRLANAIVGLGVVLSVFAVGRAVFGARTGAWAAAVIAGAHPMAIRSAELLGDLPATAGVLAGVAVLAGELTRPDGARWRIALAAPAFAAAFYLRYASAPVIAIAAIAALVLWWRSMLVRPVPVVAAAVLLAALLVPHAVYSLHETGSLLGVLQKSSGVPFRAYWADGLVTYVTSNPFSYYGAVVTPVIGAALVGLARRFRSRAPWFLATVGLGQLLAIGLESHAQPRYVFAAIALLVVLGVETLRCLARPRAALAVLAAAWLAIAIACVPYDLAVRHARSSILAAAAAVRADHRSGPCTAIVGEVPQVMWYSRCAGVLTRVVGLAELQSGRDRYIVSTQYSAIDGPAFAAAHGIAVAELPTGDSRARVWVVR